MADVTITVAIDTTEVDEATQKVERLSELITEAKLLPNDLASMDLKADSKLM